MLGKKTSTLLILSGISLIFLATYLSFEGSAPKAVSEEVKAESSVQKEQTSKVEIDKDRWLEKKELPDNSKAISLPRELWHESMGYSSPTLLGSKVLFSSFPFENVKKSEALTAIGFGYLGVVENMSDYASMRFYELPSPYLYVKKSVFGLAPTADLVMSDHKTNLMMPSPTQSTQAYAFYQKYKKTINKRVNLSTRKITVLNKDNDVLNRYSIQGNQMINAVFLSKKSDQLNEEWVALPINDLENNFYSVITKKQEMEDIVQKQLGSKRTDGPEKKKAIAVDYSGSLKELQLFTRISNQSKNIVFVFDVIDHANRPLLVSSIAEKIEMLSKWVDFKKTTISYYIDGEKFVLDVTRLLSLKESSIDDSELGKSVFKYEKTISGYELLNLVMDQEVPEKENVNIAHITDKESDKNSFLEISERMRLAFNEKGFRYHLANVNDGPVNTANYYNFVGNTYSFGMHIENRNGFLFFITQTALIQ